MRENSQEPDSRDHGYTLTRTLDTPAARVWQYWTDEDHLKRWFGPKGFEILEASLDLRAGGKWRTRMRSATGDVHTTHGVYTEVVDRSRLVMTQCWEGSTDRSEITVTLTGKKHGTEVVFEHRRLASADARDSHAEGWSEALDRLERHAAA